MLDSRAATVPAHASCDLSRIPLRHIARDAGLAVHDFVERRG